MRNPQLSRWQITAIVLIFYSLAFLASAAESSSEEDQLDSIVNQPNWHHVYLPLVSRALPECMPIPGVVYGLVDPDGPPTDRPAAVHADLNLALRDYELNPGASLSLIDYGGGTDPNAPQLAKLFGPKRVPQFTAGYRVYNWIWQPYPNPGYRGSLITYPDVTLIGMQATDREVLYLPNRGNLIGQGEDGRTYDALVLYAEEHRITIKYTREDNVVTGYTMHLENVCVDPVLLQRYRSADASGRALLPGLQGGQAFATEYIGPIRVAIRDNGTFLDPRSRKDWWKDY